MMPLAQEMAGGRSEQAALVHRLAPGLFPNLHYRLPAGQKAEVPGRTQPGDEIHPIGQSGQLLRGCGIRIERSVNRTTHLWHASRKIWGSFYRASGTLSNAQERDFLPKAQLSGLNIRLAQQFAPHGKGLGCGVCGGGFAAPTNPTLPFFTDAPLPRNDLRHKPNTPHLHCRKKRI